MIDSEDAELVRQTGWFLFTSKSGNQYAKGIIAGKAEYLHRLVMRVLDAPSIRVDHRDGNGLNCKKENLREATHAQNSMNRRAKKHRFKGVYAWRTKWRAIIRLDGRNINIGSFDDAIAAALAYNQKASQLFGDFACLNKIRQTARRTGDETRTL